MTDFPYGFPADFLTSKKVSCESLRKIKETFVQCLLPLIWLLDKPLMNHGDNGKMANTSTFLTSYIKETIFLNLLSTYFPHNLSSILNRAPINMLFFPRFPLCRRCTLYIFFSSLRVEIRGKNVIIFLWSLSGFFENLNDLFNWTSRT